jgi:hypothetical protein
MGLVKEFFAQLITSPVSPEGRKLRIDMLIKTTHRERDLCAAVVYARDAGRGYQLNLTEKEDAARIAKRIENHEIVIPGDWNQE